MARKEKATIDAGQVLFYPKREQKGSGIDGFVAKQNICPFCESYSLFDREDLGDFPSTGSEGWYMQCGGCHKIFGCLPTTHSGMYFKFIKNTD